MACPCRKPFLICALMSPTALGVCGINTVAFLHGHDSSLSACCTRHMTGEIRWSYFDSSCDFFV